MRDQYSSKLNTYLNVLAVCTRYKATWGHLPAFERCFNEVNSLVEKINELNTNLQVSIKVTTAGKQRLKHEMANRTLAVVGAARSYGNYIGDQDLVKEMTLRSSAILDAKSTDADDICLSKIRKAQQILAHLSDFGITQMEMDIAIAAITNYTGMISKPMSTRMEIKGANSQMKSLFDQIRVKLKDGMDPLMAQFKTSSPTFYMEYFSSRKLSSTAKTKKPEIK